MTNYVVLKRLDTERAGQWEQLTAQYASSARQAIRKTVDGGGGSGTYIAIPVRSFKQEMVKMEQKTAIVFGEHASRS